MLGDETSDLFERKLAKTINGSIGHNDTEVVSSNRRNSSPVNQIKDFNVENEIPRHDRLIESMENFSNEINLRLSKELDSLMSMMG